jgi:hypothetical protein
MWQLARFARPASRTAEWAARIASYEFAARMQLCVPEFTDLSRESAATLRAYGAGSSTTRSSSSRRSSGGLPTFQNDASWRDHNPKGFTSWLLDAGVNAPDSFGATDEFG